VNYLNHYRSKLWLTVLTVTLVLSAMPAAAQLRGPSVEPRTDWQADWIGVIGGSKPNTWICFRKEVTLASLPKSALARIACDSKYWLWINGKLALFEGQLKRGPTPQDTYFDVVDLQPHLQSGKNQIAILVCHFGRHGFSHNSSGKAGLLFDAVLDDQPLLSDGTWKAKVHPAFGTTDPPLDNVRPPESNLCFDARHDIGEWQSPTYDDSAWGPALAFGRPPIGPWNQLYERPIPHWRDTGLIDYADPLPTPFTTTGEPIVGRLPYNCQVTPYFEIDAPAGQTIGLETDIRSRYGKIPLIETHHHQYITRAGKQSFELPLWINGHEVRYLFPAGVKVLALKYRETSYDTEVVGSFHCDDPQLNQLWLEAQRTLSVTMRDTYMDCPDRERAQWWGDAVNEIGEAFYVFEPQRSPLLARKAIYELTRWQRPDNTLYSPVPSGVRHPSIKDPIDGSWEQELPQQILASVGWYGFWNYYVYSGDQQTVVDAYPAVRKYLALWKLGDDGLVVHRPGGWDWTDWGQHFDTPVCENAWYYLALKGALAQAKLAGADQDVAGYQTAMRSIEANFNRVFWQQDHYQSTGHVGPTDDRANAMAVVAGLAEPEYCEAIVKVLETERHASPYMEKYVLESLLKLRRPDVAISRMKGRYAEMLNDEQTTLWELFDELTLEGFGSVGKGTYNHAWSGGPLTILSQYVAGIEPTAPGFTRYSVRPQLGPLKQIDTKVPTRSGMIDLQIRSKPNSNFKLRLQSPPGLLAEVGIPVDANSIKSDVLLNGQQILKGDEEVDHEHDVKYMGRKEGYLVFTVPPGDWNFALLRGDKNLAASPTTFTVTPEPLASKSISPRLYGNFIELGYGYQVEPMWAEMLFNRSFEPFKPYKSISVEWFDLWNDPGDQSKGYRTDWREEDWYHSGYEHSPWFAAPGRGGAPPIDEQSTFIVTESPESSARLTPLAGGSGHGVQHLRVSSRAGGGWAGVAQEGKLLRRGAGYRFRGMFRAPSGATKAELRLYPEGDWTKPIVALPLGKIGADWEPRTIEITGVDFEGRATLAIWIRRGAELDIDDFSLTPRETTHGWRPEVVDKLRELRPGIVRFPGGCFASFYDWRDGVGPLSQRPPQPSYFWGGLNYNDVGTAELALLCREIDAEMMYCVNVHHPLKPDYEWYFGPLGPPPGPHGYDFQQFRDIDAGAERAAQLVAYCNLPAGAHPMADLRVAHGHREPFGVKYWELDNEVHRWFDPSEYAQAALKYATAMKAIDPSIKIGLVTYGKRVDARGQLSIEYQDQVADMLEVAGNKLDFLADRGPSSKEHLEKMIQLLRDFEEQTGRRLLYCETEKLFLEQVPDFENRIPPTRGYTKSYMFSKWFYAMRVLMEYLAYQRAGGDVDFVIYNNLANTHSQCVIETPKEGAYLTAGGVVMRELGRSPAAWPLKFADYEARHDDNFQVSAAWDRDRRRLVLYVLNRTDESQEYSFDVRPLGRSLHKLETTVLSADGPFVMNTMDAPDAIRRRTSREEKAIGGSVTGTAEPWSFTQLIVE
jgi:alpha-L-rhamnosidase